MKEKEKIIILEDIIKNTLWMARRYAHGRHTYAPSTVRDAIKQAKSLGIKIQKDPTIDQPSEEDIGGMSYRKDYLDDTNL